MAEDRIQRRLAAILAADVVGYSRLMETDEADTMAALKSRRNDVLEPLVAKHHGRIFKVAGDGVLVEFSSAVNAVQCAVDLQQGMATANGGQFEDHHIVLRIGVNLGDVMVEGGDLYGDGVNIAARLEGLAEPGGIVLSASTHEQVRAKLALGYEDLGERELKNIAQPVRVYRLAGVAAEPSVKTAPQAKPAVVVLPFTNMSGDPGQDYFSDGITEDIITEIARYRSLAVIARNSAFQFRGPAVDLDAVRRKLGVRYIVEGSVRRAGERLRITAQLIDAASKAHLWAERYDRDMSDVFAVQDEVARTIAATLEGRVVASGAAAARSKPTIDWVAYDYFLRGRERDAAYDQAAAEALFARAAALDPSYVHAHAFQAMALVVRYWLEGNPALLRQGEAAAWKALSLDDHDGSAHQAAGYIALHQRQFDQARQHLDRAVALNPNDVLILSDHANLLTRVGQPKEALRELDSVLQRDPFPVAYHWDFRGTALFQLGRYDEAIAALGNLQAPPHWNRAYLAAAHAWMGRLDVARREIELLSQTRPDASIALVAKAEPYADAASLDRLLDGLRKAGLPE